uniref:Nucleoside phosphorylase domain-containing protein n=1 Tax=Bionectria ochroleuca TaxID=29856 RepID=A0A8H7N403_BIOOC
MEPTRPKNRLGFEIAIICALTIEADAVEALFDQYWDDDGPDYEKAPGDPNAYSTGSIGKHNVVLARMPDMGKVSSATVAVNCRVSFPNIKLALVVGICGAVPFIPKSNIDIYLGDVIVSRGIVQYDLGHRLPGQFIRKDTVSEDLGRPSGEIRSFLAKREGIRGRKGLRTKTITYLNSLRNEPELEAEYPGVQYDKLFKAMYRHVSDGNRCEECGCSGDLVVRARHSQDTPQPAIHFGLIASGDAVMKCGVERDDISKQEGVIGFEMEGAGVWDTFPCIVIKGACDYADSHKTKVWQRYAASTAAACTKALLEFWSPSNIAPHNEIIGPASPTTKYIIPYTKNPDFVGRSEILDWLTGQLKFTQETSGLVQTRVALYGLGGTGKTQIALEFVLRLQQTRSNVSIFWVHASSTQRFRQAFASIAQAFEIPGYEDPKHDLLLLVKNWLMEKTHGEWVMILDNADDAELFFGQPSETVIDITEPKNLAHYLPECPHGSLLITTRNKQAAVRLTKGRGFIEVPRMNDIEAVKLLRSSLDDTETASADLSALSSYLEHLPLALAQAAAYIKETTIAVKKYLKLLGDNDSDKKMTHLLSKEFETAGRDSQTPKAVIRTWMLSFQQIERQHSLASELLSFMSLLDRQDIPEEFISYYNEKESESGTVNEMELLDAMGLLKAFSFVTENTDGGFNMHRLIQLATRKWLASRDTIGQFSSKALRIVANIYPSDHYDENRNTCIRYLSHANMVLEGSQPMLYDEAETRLRILDSITEFYEFELLWDDAEKTSTRAVNLCQEINGADHPTTLKSMSMLTSIYNQQNRWEEAENLGIQVVEGQKRKLGVDHLETLASMRNLAEAISGNNRLEEAEKLIVQVIDTQKIKLGADHPDILTSMSSLAGLYANHEQLDKAEKMVVQVLETQKKIFGTDHISTLGSMVQLAGIIGSSGINKEAVQLAGFIGNDGRNGEVEYLMKEAINGLTIKLGADHLAVLDLMDYFALICVNMGRVEEAEKLATQVMEAKKKKLGGSHPDTLNTMTLLAHLFDDNNQWGKAEKMFLQIVDAQEMGLGANHPNTLNHKGILALRFLEQGRLDEAEKLEAQVMEGRLKHLGDDDLGTLTSMANLASIYGGQERWQEAEKLDTHVLAMRKLKLGVDHPDTLVSMGNLAHDWKGQGRTEEALELMLERVEAQRRIMGPEHSITKATMIVVDMWKAEK